MSAQAQWSIYIPYANLSPTTPTSQPLKKPLGMEVKQHHTMENIEKDLLAVQQLEETLDIEVRWTPAHPK